MYALATKNVLSSTRHPTILFCVKASSSHHRRPAGRAAHPEVRAVPGDASRCTSSPPCHPRPLYPPDDAPLGHDLHNIMKRAPGATCWMLPCNLVTCPRPHGRRDRGMSPCTGRRRPLRPAPSPPTTPLAHGHCLHNIQQRDPGAACWMQPCHMPASARSPRPWHVAVHGASSPSPPSAIATHHPARPCCLASSITALHETLEREP